VVASGPTADALGSVTSRRSGRHAYERSAVARARSRPARHTVNALRTSITARGGIWEANAGSWFERSVAVQLDRTLIFNGRYLSKILTEYAEHYNDHRPHQSRRQRPPAVENVVTRPIADLADVHSIRRQPVLDGLINQCYWAA
jgi:hypothetical protein